MDFYFSNRLLRGNCENSKGKKKGDINLLAMKNESLGKLHSYALIIKSPGS